MRKKSLQEKEAELIASARSELAASPVPGPEPAPAPMAAPAAAPAFPTSPPTQATANPDVAARVAALLAAEQEHRLRRRKRLQQVGLAVPALAAVAAILWLASVLLRYLRF